MMFRINYNLAVKVIVISVASLLLLTTVADAAANGGSPGSGSSAVSSYAGGGDSGGRGGLFVRLSTLNQEVPIGDSPSGCVQSAHNPHLSHHALPLRKVNAEIRAKCNNAVERMFHSATLFESRRLRWIEVGHRTFDRANVREGRAYANAPCKRETYQGIGAGYIIDIDGETYIAATASRPIYNPCDM